MCGRCLLVRQRLFELRLVGLSELRLGDVAFRHLLIGLRLPAAKLSCSGGAGLGTAPVAGIGTSGACCSGPIGVTGFGTALDWSGAAAVAVSMSFA